MKSKKKIKNRTGFPGDLVAVDSSFDGPDAMTHALDALLAFLTKTYARESPRVSTTYGFIIRRITVVRDPTVTDVEVRSDPGQSLAVIHLPEIKNESDEQWQLRRDHYLGNYWPTMQDAQIRATAQLYRLLTVPARRKLESLYAR